jgi:hypothetical protein
LHQTAAARAPGLATYGGLFFTTLSTLMYEILLTRIFSVTMWYHFAFVAVSVALFGMTAGALIVHLAPRFFTQERVNERLAQAAMLFSISIAASFVIQVYIPFDPEWSAGALALVALTYLVIAVPFVCSGVAVCLALTRYPGQVGRLYAADLAGAALGTLTLIWLLDRLRDAPSAVFAIAALAALGAALFILPAGRRQHAALAGLCALLLLGFAAGNAVSVRQHHPILRLVHVKGGDEGVPLYETWNAFSRIRVDGDPGVLEPAVAAGGVHPSSDGPRRLLSLTIDATAGTVLFGYDGDRESLDFIRDDIVNLPHFIRPDASVFIIGTGGAGNVLAAFAFDQPSVTAVEMNGAILNVVNKRYGDFTGHLDREPGVRFVNDEARAYLSRLDERFDIIQVPFTDTWAATAAGAFALSENGLYTVEAWQRFYEHLTDRGLLSVTRWHYLPQPMESYRLVSLAGAALRREGIDRPRDYVVLARGPEVLPDIAVSTNILIRTPNT